jgi:hypothetical protein
MVAFGHTHLSDRPRALSESDSEHHRKLHDKAAAILHRQSTNATFPAAERPDGKLQSRDANAIAIATIWLLLFVLLVGGHITSALLRAETHVVVRN